MISPNDLFLNIWARRAHEELASIPGSKNWDQKTQHAYWAKVWQDCFELVRHLAEVEQALTVDHLSGVVDPPPQGWK